MRTRLCHQSFMASLKLLLLSFYFSFSFFAILLASPDTYIIHMNSSLFPKAFKDHHSWYYATLSSVTDNGSTLNHIYTYTNVIHGFSASLSASQLKELEKHPGYIATVKDIPIITHTTHTSEFLGLTSASGAWSASQMGKGVVIGLVDTGIWPESKSFDDSGFSEAPTRWKGGCAKGTGFNSSLCNKKLIGAQFYNKGLLSKKPNATITMNSPRDIDGHGTHTSSTAAGNFIEEASFFGYAKGSARGMAPQAHVAMYKAVWGDAGAYASDVLAAIDQAITDGVDVLSLSLGISGVPLYEDTIAMATFAAMEKGVFVASSAGNDGPWSGTVHNGVPWLLNIAAGTVDRGFHGVVSLENGTSVNGMTLYHGNSHIVQLPLVWMNLCDNIQKLKQIGNQIVVCKDQDGYVGMQASKAGSARVAGGIFISNTSNLEFFMDTSFPATFLSLEQGHTLLNYMKGDPRPRASMEFKKTIIGSERAPKVAAYSSRGPSASCPSILKPDIMAPGSLVLASWALPSPVAKFNSQDEFHKFNIISGTSMACPHAAGVAALLKAAHPEWSPAAIRSAMMTTADALDNLMEAIKDNGEHGKPASPLAMGAGHINPNKALEPGLIYNTTTEDYVKLLCGMNYTRKQIQMITRSSTYSCSFSSLDINYPSFIAFFNSSQSYGTNIEHTFERTVTNVGNGKAYYISKLMPLTGFETRVVPEKLVFRNKYESKSYKLIVKGPRVMKEQETFGSLTWIDTENMHVVRSPIVAIVQSPEF